MKHKLIMIIEQLCKIIDQNPWVYGTADQL